MTIRKSAAVPEPEEPQEVQGVVVHRPGDVGLRQYAERTGVIGMDDNTSTYQRIVEEILSKTTVDEIFSDQVTYNLEDIIGRPMTVMGFRVLASDYDQGAEIYVSIDVQFDGSTRQDIVNTGNQGVVAQLFAAHQSNLFPVRLYVKQTGERRENGFIPLRLVGVK